MKEKGKMVEFWEESDNLPHRIPENTAKGTACQAWSWATLFLASEGRLF